MSNPNPIPNLRVLLHDGGWEPPSPHHSGFRSVVVITFASHAKGPRFETGRKQFVLFPFTFKSML